MENYKELKTNSNVIKGEIFPFMQENCWIDSKLFYVWYNYIFLQYEKKIGKKCLLILDKSPSHIDEMVLSEFRKNGTYFEFIPCGLTKYLQPLELGLNEIFKKEIKKGFINIDQTHEIKNLNKLQYYLDSDWNKKRDEIINIVHNVWKNDNYIQKNTIINSFLKSGLILKFDGSNAEFFQFPEYLNDIDSIYDNYEYSK